jgi:hypothetical protein
MSGNTLCWPSPEILRYALPQGCERQYSSVQSWGNAKLRSASEPNYAIKGTAVKGPDSNQASIMSAAPYFGC